MKTVTLVEFRRNAQAILARVRKGESLVLTSRARPVARLEPPEAGGIDRDDPLYRLADLARDGGETLSNDEIDRILYGR